MLPLSPLGGPFDRLKPPLGSTINSAHPLGRGLQIAWLFEDGGAKKVRSSGPVLADLIPQSAGGGTGVPTYKPDPFSGIAANFVAANSQYLGVQNAGTNNSAPLSAYPFTFACWFYSHTNSTTYCLFSLQEAAPGASGNFLQLFSANGGTATPSVLVGNGTTTGRCTTTTSYTNKSWNLAVMVCTAANLRAVYLNNSGKATNTTSITPTGISNTYLGAWLNSSDVPTNPLNGMISAAYMWNRALTDSEVATLYLKPFSMFRRQSPWSFSGVSGAATGTVKFRKTLSRVGTGVGRRQAIGV